MVILARLHPRTHPCSRSKSIYLLPVTILGGLMFSDHVMFSNCIISYHTTSLPFIRQADFFPFRPLSVQVSHSIPGLYHWARCTYSKYKHSYYRNISIFHFRVLFFLFETCWKLVCGQRDPFLNTMRVRRRYCTKYGVFFFVSRGNSLFLSLGYSSNALHFYIFSVLHRSYHAVL